MSMPPVHIAVMQPAGYVHSLGFLDHARYFRHQFRRQGVEDVTIGKNRLREDAINFVFGAHLGFPAALRERHVCVFVNLEQLGDGGAAVDPAYLKLLSESAVVDYDADNVAAYAQNPADVPLVSFLHAPYLADGAAPIPLAERPIDLLFFGSMNERRRAFIGRVEACGVQVAAFDHPLYGAERDGFIRQAKAVLNCHFYETSRFEQARVFQCLSLGTPVISERNVRTRAPAAYDDAVFWLDDEAALDRFFTTSFRSGAFAAESEARLAAFRRHDPAEAYGDVLAFAIGYAQVHAKLHPAGIWCPNELHLGSGDAYQAGWLNVAADARTAPDLALDLGAPLELPLHRPTLLGGEAAIDAGSLDVVYATGAHDQVSSVDGLMDNVLTLLKSGGHLVCDWPLEEGEPDWARYTAEFWRQGWFEHRFEITASAWVDARRQPAGRDTARFARTTLRRVEMTQRERTLARMQRADFGGLPDDVVPAEAPVATATGASVPVTSAGLPSLAKLAALQVDAPPATSPAASAPATRRTLPSVPDLPGCAPAVPAPALPPVQAIAVPQRSLQDVFAALLN